MFTFYIRAIKTYESMFCLVCFGGTDCNDYDPDIHPVVLEIADDGIDQDCDEGDNTSTGVYWIEHPEDH